MPRGVPRVPVAETLGDIDCNSEKYGKLEKFMLDKSLSDR